MYQNNLKLYYICKKSMFPGMKPFKLYKKEKKMFLEELGFEPRTFSMRSRHSTTELHPLLNILLSNWYILSMSTFCENINGKTILRFWNVFYFCNSWLRYGIKVLWSINNKKRNKLYIDVIMYLRVIMNYYNY